MSHKLRIPHFRGITVICFRTSEYWKPEQGDEGCMIENIFRDHYITLTHKQIVYFYQYISPNKKMLFKWLLFNIIKSHATHTQEKGTQDVTQMYLWLGDRSRDEFKTLPSDRVLELFRFLWTWERSLVHLSNSLELWDNSNQHLSGYFIFNSLEL